MKSFRFFKTYSYQSGVTTLGALLFVIAFFLVLFGIDLGVVEYFNYCGDEQIDDCIAGRNKTSQQPAAETAAARPPIIAHGSFSYKNYSVTVTMNIPSDGGAVVGKAAGDCNAKITGTFSGGDGGVIKGKAFGSCSPFFVPIPAHAEFTGSINRIQKTVPISGTADAFGIKKSGSTTLTIE